MNIRVRLGLLSIFGSSGILLLKFYAYNLTGSAALKSDAYEGLVNVGGALFALGAVIFAEKPADRDHPYGHGKIEYFSAAFEGGLISLAAMLIMYESVRILIVGEELRNLDRGMIINLGAGCLNGALGYFLLKQGQKHRSEAIQADGAHVLTDFYTTLAIGAGLMVMKLTGLQWLDPVIGIVVALFLARTGFYLVQGSAGALLDAEDPATIKKLAGVIREQRPSDVIAVHELRAIRSGRYTHVDVHVVVPEFYEVRRAHDVVDAFCGRVIHEAKVEGEFHTHVDPCGKLFCRRCEVTPCPIRAEAFKERASITPESVVELGPPEI